MAQPIKVPTRIRTGEARQLRRTERLLTRSITRTRTEPWAPPKVQMATNMPPRTAIPTRIPGAAGRAPIPIPMPRTVTEAAVDRKITAAAPHLHSAAGAVILVATPVGAPSLRAPRAGAAEAAAVVGAGAAGVVVVGAAVVSLKDGSQDGENPE